MSAKRKCIRNLVNMFILHAEPNQIETIFNEWNGMAKTEHWKLKMWKHFHRRNECRKENTFDDEGIVMWVMTANNEKGLCVRYWHVYYTHNFPNSNEFAQNNRVRPFAALSYTKFKRILEFAGIVAIVEIACRFG